MALLLRLAAERPSLLLRVCRAASTATASASSTSTSSAAATVAATSAAPSSTSTTPKGDAPFSFRSQKQQGSSNVSISSTNLKDLLKLRVEHDEMTSKFINCLMMHGKKAVAQRIFEDMLFRIKAAEIAKFRAAAAKKAEATKGAPSSSSSSSTAAATATDTGAADSAQPIVDPLDIFVSAVEKVKPVIGVMPLRKGSSVMQVPTPLSPRRRQSLALKWIIKAARGRTGKPIAQALLEEITAIHAGEGNAMKKKVELHKTAESNRANIVR
eukprot:m.52520 g.52520  ORF g.52520 m.52520 type:complete len:270 (+) comp13080_c0_seq1:37-846(+)